MRAVRWVANFVLYSLPFACAEAVEFAVACFKAGDSVVARKQECYRCGEGMFSSAQSASSRAMKSLLVSGVSTFRAIDKDDLMTPSGRKVMQGESRRQKRHFG